MTTGITSRIACALLVALASSANTPARAGLQAWVRPAVAFAPAAVKIEVLIEADEANRALRIVADSGEYLRSSIILLEGARAARYHSVVYRSIPAGHYVIEVELLDQTDTVRAIERHWLDVVS